MRNPLMMDLNLKQKTMSLRRRDNRTVGIPVGHLAEADDPVQHCVPVKLVDALEPSISDEPVVALELGVTDQPVTVEEEERANMYDENTWDDFLV